MIRLSSVGYATLSVIPSMRGFGSKLSSGINPEMDRAGKTGGARFGASMSSTATGHGSKVGRILGAGLLGGLGAALVGIGAVIKTGFGEVMDASAGTAQLEAGIKSTGNVAGVSVKGLNALASSIQSYSGQTDDSIVAAEKLLLTFTNIRNTKTDKIFDQATLASANMAAKFGGDASGSAIQLGKALQDPIKGVGMLARVGVVFTQKQKDAIAAMMKTGDLAGAQKLVLAELTTEFGGAAKAAGDSLPGKLAKGQRAFEDLSQSIVEGAAPAFSNVATEATAFVKGMQDGTGAGGRFRDVLVDTGSKIGTVVGWLKDHTTAVKVAAIGVGVLTVAVQAHNLALAISTGSLKAWILQTTIVKTATAVWAAGQWLLNAALTANPIGLVIVAIAALVGGIILIATKTTWFQTIWKVMTDGLALAWQWLWNTILAPVIRFVLNGFASITDGIAGMLRVLSNIPGFGWAKTAADKMDGAADKARGLAKDIKDIKSPPPIALTFSSNLSAIGKKLAAAGVKSKLTGFASGTNFAPGGPALVGERGPEIVNLPRGSQVIPNHKIGAGSGGNTFYIYEAVSGLATAMQVSRRQAALGAV